MSRLRPLSLSSKKLAFRGHLALAPLLPAPRRRLSRLRPWSTVISEPVVSEPAADVAHLAHALARAYAGRVRVDRRGAMHRV